MTRKMLKKDYPKCFEMLKSESKSILNINNFLQLDKFFEKYNIEFFEGGNNSCIVMPHGFKGAWAAAEVGIDDKDIDIGPFETRKECIKQSHLIGFKLLEGTYEYPKKEKKHFNKWKEIGLVSSYILLFSGICAILIKIIF